MSIEHFKYVIEKVAGFFDRTAYDDVFVYGNSYLDYKKGIVSTIIVDCIQCYGFETITFLGESPKFATDSHKFFSIAEGIHKLGKELPSYDPFRNSRLEIIIYTTIEDRQDAKQRDSLIRNCEWFYHANDFMGSPEFVEKLKPDL